MKAALIFPIALALLVGGCATNQVSPVEVTRFVGDTPHLLGQGAIAVRPAPGREADSLEFSFYGDAVAAELRGLGYTVVQGDAPQVAEIGLTRSIEQAIGSRSPVSVGGAASTGSYGSGVGLGIGLDLSGRPKDRVITQMRVMIRPSAGGQALWEGRASLAAPQGSEYADARNAAQRLANALFTGFPGNSGETIEVR